MFWQDESKRVRQQKILQILSMSRQPNNVMCISANYMIFVGESQLSMNLGFVLVFKVTTDP